MQRSPAHLTVIIDDATTTLEQHGGSSQELPVGPVTLTRDVLTDHDPPRPEELTNALGLVADHLDDALIESPSLVAPNGITIVGDHAIALARVELGADEVPPDHRLRRGDIDEVFRTIATESATDRGFNPGLDPSHVDSIVGTCCVVLAILRRLDAAEVVVAARPPEAIGAAP